MPTADTLPSERLFWFLRTDRISDILRAVMTKPPGIGRRGCAVAVGLKAARIRARANVSPLSFSKFCRSCPTSAQVRRRGAD